MIEFDVLPDKASGKLKLAHDYNDLQQRSDAVTLAEALDHLSAEKFSGIEFDVDLKLAGYEDGVATALKERDLNERSLISCMNRAVLLRLRALDSKLRLGWSVPRVSRDYTQVPLLAIPALGVLEIARRTLPGRASRALKAGDCDAIMAHWRLVTPQLVAAVKANGGELYVWTVDDRKLIEKLSRLGVSAIISNDPRLFQTSP